MTKGPLHFLSTIFQDGGQLILAQVVGFVGVFSRSRGFRAEMRLRCIHLVDD